MATADSFHLASFPSPSRGVIQLGPVPLRAYAVFIIIGIVVAILWGNRRFVARGGRPGTITDVSVFAVPFGIVGGRLYHVITDNQLYFRPGRNPWRAFAIWEGGLGIWGAVALGAVGAWLGCRRYGIPLGSYADSIAPGLVLAQAIGRVGNYFNQELFGSPTTMPWGLDIFVRTPGGVAGGIGGNTGCEFPPDYVKAVPEVLCGTFQPTFLYELLWCLGVAALVVWADRKFQLGGGRAFALYVAGYTLGRGWIETLRSDPANHFLGLRINVVTSIVVFLAAVVFLVLRRTPREDPATLQKGEAGPSTAPADGKSTAEDAEFAADSAPTEFAEPASVSPGAVKTASSGAVKTVPPGAVKTDETSAATTDLAAPQGDEVVILSKTPSGRDTDKS
ncbi:prolipoprotein diacylglyceryl transferase [Nakamurella antarctica]|uniref:Phosphatidylglycerol--prolipoprotein diacylglyceryl transferase n=2 Tax=Nakamurella antarctica TaxID=1902245 RepID=A0A3G8ZQ37_9ACTN|nr:prolipoprotein diacylglyceryl transferase [Nakamurella antarctica]